MYWFKRWGTHQRYEFTIRTRRSASASSTTTETSTLALLSMSLQYSFLQIILLCVLQGWNRFHIFVHLFNANVNLRVSRVNKYSHRVIDLNWQNVLSFITSFITFMIWKHLFLVLILEILSWWKKSSILKTEKKRNWTLDLRNVTFGEVESETTAKLDQFGVCSFICVVTATTKVFRSRRYFRQDGNIYILQYQVRLYMMNSLSTESI